jgi:protein-disulfide isomerase
LKHTLPVLLITLFFISACSQLRNINIADSAMLGPMAARTEIIVFSDFQCPFCKKAAKELNRLHTAYPNRFKLYFKHFPLKYHQWSEQAARAAEAAGMQGKFWQMHDLLFAWSDQLDENTFLELAQKLNLNEQQFMDDYNSEKIKQKVQADKAEGERLKISGTPYFFINRTPFHGSYIDIRRELSTHR